MKRGATPAAAIVLLLVTLLAVGLRLFRLDAQSLWYDEAFSVYLARLDLTEITARTAADIQPPLYYCLLHSWIGLFGDSENALRGLSVLFGVLTIPLVYGLSWQLFRNRFAALLAALLVAASPLHVWYGQEARMYTLLTFLCLLSSYCLLLLIDRTRPLPSAGGGRLSSQQTAGWRWMASAGRAELLLWLAFTLASVAALYTHYFALFVLACQGIYLILVWWGRGGRPARLLLGGLASGLVTFLAYLPWLPHLLTRYGTDVSYWPGRLKLHEVLLDIVLSFVGGESVLERVGGLLAIGYGLAFVLCLLALLLRAAGGPSLSDGQDTRRTSSALPRETAGAGLHPLPSAYYPLLFLLLYLFLPPALILALSYNAPKFNARYVMVSHPALLLILAGGLAALWQQRRGCLGSIWRTLAGLTLAYILGVSAYAICNAYTDPAFARADFRGVVRYLEEQIEADETIILSSGHMYPAFDYYAPDLERHLLPDTPTLDTNRTLDYSIAADLNRWLGGRGGVWLVLWQYDVVDPAGYLTAILAEAGAQQQSIGQTFAKVDLQHYRLPAGVVFSDQPAIAHPADFNFGNRLRLLGYTQTGDRQVTLFWEALQPLAEDYRVSLTLRDTVGQSWGQWDGRPTSYLYPTDRWSVGQVVLGHYNLALEPGSPPGDYGLEVGVYTEADPVGLDLLDSAGAPQGKRAMLGAVRLSVPAVTADQVRIPRPIEADLGGGLSLLGWDLSHAEAQPGDRLLLTLIWSVRDKPQGDYAVRVLITDAANQVWDAGTFPPTNAWHPTSIWLPGQAWCGRITFRLPIQTQPGEARLAVELVAADAGRVDLGTVQVQPTSRIFTLPQPQVLRRANFDDRITLLGADVGPDPVAPGSVLRLTLYWQAQAEMDVPYTVFVHLLDLDGKVVTGDDGEPASGTRPTTGWVPGEYIADSHDLSIPLELPPGAYVVEVGLYDAGAPNMPRLPILDESGQGTADRVIFGPVQVRR